MKTLFTLPLFVLSLCAASHGRIGETLEQCEQRYGTPTKQAPPGGMVSFLVSGTVIAVTFHEGKADSVVFRKPKSESPGKFAEFTDTELEEFMQANGGGREWVKGSAKSPDRQWATSDNELFAHYNAAERLFAIGTKGYVDRKGAGKKP